MSILFQNQYLSCPSKKTERFYKKSGLEEFLQCSPWQRTIAGMRRQIPVVSCCHVCLIYPSQQRRCCLFQYLDVEVHPSGQKTLLNFHHWRCESDVVLLCWFSLEVAPSYWTIVRSSRWSGRWSKFAVADNRSFLKVSC